MTAELDLSVFKAAAEELKGDEFIVDKKRFSMDATLHALHVGGARLDAHLIAGGIHSFRDLESHGIPVPDEGATVQEVGEIQGHLFDCLVTRLNGHSAFLSTGVSAYVHRGFEFKNELLRLVVLCHVSLVDAVEEFARTKWELHTPLWSMDHGHPSFNFMHEVDVEQLRKELSGFSESGAEKLLAWARFELEFGEFVRGKCELPALVELPAASREIGASKYIHYRDLPPSVPPPATMIPNHEEACKQFTSMYNDIRELLSYPKPAKLLEMFQTLYDWQQSHLDMISFARLFWFSRVVTERKQFEEDFEKMINQEFLAMGVPLRAFQLPDATEYKPGMCTLSMQLIRGFVCPPSISHQNLVKNGLKMLSIMETCTCGIEAEVLKFVKRPQTNSDQMNKITSTPVFYWARRILVFFHLCYLKYELQNDIVNINDYAGLFMSFASCYDCLFDILQRQRTIELVSKHLPPKKPGKKRIVRSRDVSEDLAVSTYEELEAKLLMNFYHGAFHFMRFCAKTNSAPFRKGVFYNEAARYEQTREPTSNTRPPIIRQYAEFHPMYDTSYASPAALKGAVLKAWEESKQCVSKAVEAKGERTPFLVGIMKSIVVSSIALSKWHEGQMFTITFDGVIPCFQLQQ